MTVKRERPLSPHLSIYKPQLTSVLSIFHRFMSVALAGSTFFLVGWLGLLSFGQKEYDYFMSYILSWPGIVCLAGVLFAFIYASANGVRHLFWDFGKGYELRSTYMTGWAVVGVSFLTWFLILFFWWRAI